MCLFVLETINQSILQNRNVIKKKKNPCRYHNCLTYINYFANDIPTTAVLVNLT